MSKSEFALVDEDLYEPLLKMGSWICQRPKSGKYAAMRNRKPNGRGYERIIFMHRVILGLKDDEAADHANGNGLDNRRCNLRKASKEQNNGNRAKHVSSVRNLASKYKGVYRPTETVLPWGAVITLNHKTTPLGRFKTELEAAKAYDKAARKAWGKFACTNFPRGEERPALRD